jgi:hypothetical protein
MDRVLHAERLIADGGKRTFRAALGDLPSGCMVRIAGRPPLLNERQLHAWTPQGYDRGEPVAPAQIVDVLTPPAIVALLRIGLKPRLHPSIA